MIRVVAGIAIILAPYAALALVGYAWLSTGIPQMWFALHPVCICIGK
jgi:hypothetical protein